MLVYCLNSCELLQNAVDDVKKATVDTTYNTTGANRNKHDEADDLTTPAVAPTSPLPKLITTLGHYRHCYCYCYCCYYYYYSTTTTTTTTAATTPTATTMTTTYCDDDFC